MQIAGKNHSSTGRALTPALLAVLALLIQALLPSAALAAQAKAPGETLVICTAMGAQTITLGADQGQPKKGFAGLPCQDCLAAAVAAIPAPEAARLQTRVAYTAVEHAPTTTEP